MIIDNISSFAIWLSIKLKPICDANPEVLSKYIIALIAKDKTREQLYNVCIKQLEVFLLNETQEFVDLLFETLESKNYIDTKHLVVEKAITTDTGMIKKVDTIEEQITCDTQIVETSILDDISDESLPNSPVQETNSEVIKQSEKNALNNIYENSSSEKMVTHRMEHHHRPSIKESYVSGSRHRTYLYRDDDRKTDSRRRMSPYRSSNRRRRRHSPRRHNDNRNSHNSRFSPMRKRVKSRSKSPVQNKCSMKDRTQLKPRCKDYDEKGFCLLGDLCTFDHGSDPVIVDDVNYHKIASATLLPSQIHPQLQQNLTNQSKNNSLAKSRFMNIPDNNNLPFIQNNQNSRMMEAYNPEAPAIISTAVIEPLHNRPYQKKPFDYKRIGGRAPINRLNASLEIRKIPQNLNNIAKVNDHFSQFGTIQNLQICYNGDADACLITYSCNEEASAAYHCPTPVFNNRFIRVFWHSEQKDNLSKDSQYQAENAGDGESINDKAVSVKERLGVIPPKAKLSIDNTLRTSAPTVTTRSNQENIQKKIVNKETIKDIRNNKVNLLNAYLSQQKALISKLESKSVLDFEKLEYMKTLKELDHKIKPLRLELSTVLSSILPLQQKPISNLSKVEAIKLNKLEKQKAMLDIELDKIVCKNNSEQDLEKKVEIIKKQAKSLGLLNTSPDNNDSRQLLIKGYESDAIDSLISTYKNYGEVKKIIEDDGMSPYVILKFPTRNSAEKALREVTTHNENPLSVEWFSMTKKSTRIVN